MMTDIITADIELQALRNKLHCALRNLILRGELWAGKAQIRLCIYSLLMIWCFHVALTLFQLDAYLTGDWEVGGSQVL